EDQPRPREQKRLVEVLEGGPVEADATLVQGEVGDVADLEPELDRAGPSHPRRPDAGESRRRREVLQGPRLGPVEVDVLDGSLRQGPRTGGENEGRCDGETH